MPPPAPTKPHMKPIMAPQITDCTARFEADTEAIFSFVVMTGFTMNLIPSSIVMKTEKLPIVVLSIREDA